MQRRSFLAALVSSVALGLTACAKTPARHSPDTALGTSLGTTSDTPLSPTEPFESGASLADAGPATLFRAPTGIVQVPVPYGTIHGLPGKGNLVALTVDDGTDPEVVSAYAVLAARTGLRLTFFANGYMPSWTEHAPLLRPLVDSGQAMIANHTWSHPDLTGLSDHGIAREVQRNERFLTDVYGVSGRPFLRPPFGFHNDRVDRVLAELGYPAVTMWYGSLGDAAVLTPQQVLDDARQWLLPQHIVIGHGNHPAVLAVLDQIVDIIHTRKLQPVHLGDVYDVNELAAASSSPPGLHPSPTPGLIPSE